MILIMNVSKGILKEVILISFHMKSCSSFSEEEALRLIISQNNKQTGYQKCKLICSDGISDRSHRKIYEPTGISRQDIQWIIKQLKFHPYHYQHIFEDYFRRLNFCIWGLDKFDDDENLFDDVLFPIRQLFITTD